MTPRSIRRSSTNQGLDMDDMHPQGTPAPHGGPGHESLDVNVRGFLLFAVGLVVMGVVIHFILGAVMSHYSAREKRAEASRPALFADERGQYPAPNLQENPATEL